MSSDIWIEEKMDGNVALRFKVQKILFSQKSAFQSVDVVETEGHGRMLFNDGMVMLSERDEHVYHEMMAHVPLFSHPNPKNVLIIGGGDGGTAREVLRHPDVEKCVMVEIDKVVVDACLEHLPQTSSMLRNEKLELIIGDGLEYVARKVQRNEDKFDVILVDSTDPVGPAQPLFGAQFYLDIFNMLKDDGIVVSQGESPFYHTEMQGKLMSILHAQFPISLIYNFSNMTYPGGLWSFTYAAKKHLPSLRGNLQKVQGDFKYYNDGIHHASFCLPSFQKIALKKFLRG